MDLSRIGEFGFIERVRGWFPESRIGDDAAVIDGLAVTTDVLLEGVHFRLDWSSPQDAGFKAVSVNVSDLAATAARPRWILLGLGAPPSASEDVLRGIYEGVREACDEYGCELVGGDTMRNDALLLAVTAIGALDGTPLTRAGALSGDVLAVTGPLGLAACGFELLRDGVTPDGPDAGACVAAHRRPCARVAEGIALRDAGAHACMDLSDGLFSDVRRIAERSAVGIEIDADAIPIAPEVARVAGSRAFELATARGEDYELLVALASVGDELLPIGRVVDEGLWLVRDGSRLPLPEGGWDHFRT